MHNYYPYTIFMGDTRLPETAVDSEDYRDILQLIDSRLSLPLVYAGCHRILQRRMPADNMYVCLVEKDGFRFPYYVDEKEPESQLDIFPKAGWTAYVTDIRERYWLQKDQKPEAKYTPVGPMSNDWVGVPIKGRNAEILGVLTVQTYKESESYKDSDVAFLEYAALAISLAVQLSIQDRDITIRRIASLVDENLDRQDIYLKLREAIQGIIPAAQKNFIVAKVEESLGVFRPVFWMDERDDFNMKDWPLDNGVSGYIYKYLRKSYIYEDGVSVIPPELKWMGTIPRYWLGAPLFMKSRIIGIVVIQSYDAEEIITKEDEYALNGVCPYIASAISHTELFSRLQRG